MKGKAQRETGRRVEHLIISVPFIKREEQPTVRGITV